MKDLCLQITLLVNKNNINLNFHLEYFETEQKAIIST